MVFIINFLARRRTVGVHPVHIRYQLKADFFEFPDCVMEPAVVAKSDQISAGFEGSKTLLPDV